MIKAYSQRLLPPYSGQVQIVESDRARAITMDGKSWEIHFMQAIPGNDNQQSVRRSYRRVAYIESHALQGIIDQTSEVSGKLDERILELAEYIISASLPFPSADIYEYWLLDAKDDSPLALIFSCTEAEFMDTFPKKTDWSTLPAAVMPVAPTEDEKARADSPVNYRLERMVAERAGINPRARWFKRFRRREHEPDEFPKLMVREDWEDEKQHSICQRYLQRQSTRLLMLHDLDLEDRQRLEIAAKDHVMEVSRFHPLYPEVVDEKLMKAILVEARLREVTSEQDKRAVQNRRDGVLYL